MMGAHRLTRREFLATCGKGLFSLALTATPLALHSEAYPSEKTGLKSGWGLVETKLSPYYKSLAGNEVQCLLCPRTCVVSLGERGYCEVRENRKGKLYSLVYGNPCAVHIDPIEKKPFFHVLPATLSFSIATAGCNFD